MPDRRRAPSKTSLASLAGVGLMLLVLCTQGGRLLWQGLHHLLWPQAGAGAADGPAPWVTGLASLVLTLLSLGAPLLYLWRTGRKQGFRVPLGKGRIPVWVLLPLFLGVMLAANSITNLLQALASALAGVPVAGTAPLPEGVFARLLYFLTTCVAAALLEELLLRGCIQGLLRPFGPRLAIAATTTVFTLLHTSLWELPTVFVLSLLLGYVAEVTRSVWPCVVLHFANNTFVFLMTLVREDMDDITALATLVWMMVALIGLFVAAVWAVRKYRLGPRFKLKKDSGGPLPQRAAGLLKVPAFAVGVLAVLAQFILPIFFG